MSTINVDFEPKIKNILNQRQMTSKKFAQEIGFSEQGLIYAFKNNSMKIGTLIKMANVLQVPLTYFFEEGDLASLPAVAVGKEQTTLPAEVEKYKKALKRERKERKAREEQLLSIIAQQAKH